MSKKSKKGLMQQLFPAEGETVPQLRFPEFRNAEDWDKKLLSDVCERFSSTILANTLVNEGNFKVYGASGYFQNVNFYKEEKTYIGIVKDGSGVGRSFICEGKSSVLSTLQIIKPKGQNNLIFIWKLIKKINFSKYVAGGAIPHIYFKDYSKENITTPLPDEQQKIADCLSSIDDLITAQAKKIELLKDHKKGLMQQLFPAEGETVPQLRFPEFRNAEDWDKKLLSDVCERFSSTILANTLVNEGNFKVYGASGYFQNVNFYKEEKTYIGIVKDGSGVGRSFICEGKSSVLSTLQIIKPKGQNNLIFIWKLIKKINFSKYVAGGAIPHIYFKDYSKENITTPLPDEQQKIADCLSSIDDLITAQAKKIELLKDHKKGLMQQLFPTSAEVEQ
ncbi:type I restriction enzyme, S subunit [Bathymodiolus japonicus methanotrophic gill symbiont]|uniref:restriction endonuclease subunit S n=1 Tax=Bathymodiolus japonicus methanotrophic gill symbiont TaxID=113269 RepID=UPI001B5EFBD7|nr:restriction endonuclease subunit S [Bathymodiolus japonicus methanotrophic gill symbiont]GFO73544.1 type I restriction enzyme, S subunit [Bathymodiolus japonicus methanotrophic gill symbiont]